MQIKPKGTKDVFSESSYKLEKVTNSLKEISFSHNFEYVETPIFEYTNLFNRIGEGTDIVSKEMYTFLDKSDRSITLRPEGTASIVRMSIENRLISEKENKTTKFYYIGDMFRYERPQKGRYRQFKQFGVEVFSKNKLSTNIEIIIFLNNIIKHFKLKNCKFVVNSIGSKETREKYVSFLTKELSNRKEELSEISKNRILSNPLRIIDSKDEKDKKVISELLTLESFLTKEEKKDFEDLVYSLESFGIPYEVDRNLVRGLDYYNDFVFEVEYKDDDGRKLSALGGGRYDSLSKEIGDIDVPSVGFAIGIDRLIELIEISNKEYFSEKLESDFYIACLSEEKEAIINSQKVRNYLLSIGKTVYFNNSNGNKIKHYFTDMDKKNPNYSILIGDNDLEKGIFLIKNMIKREQKEINFNKLEEIKNFIEK